MLSDFLKISPRVTVLPIIHGSGDCALEVRRVMLEQKFDCLAVPLPPSFQHDVERAIEYLPAVTVVAPPKPVSARPAHSRTAGLAHRDAARPVTGQVEGGDVSRHDDGRG